MTTPANRISMFTQFKKICVDAVEPGRVGRFWAAALDQRWQPDDRGEGGLVDRHGRVTVWFNRVAEPRTVKHRVHLDLYAGSLADLTVLGSTVVLPQGDDRQWTMMADPEGGEYCAFLRDEVPDDRLHGLVVDSVEPGSQARWWAGVLGGRVVDDARGFSTVEGIHGLEGVTFDFVPVPEPKTAPNRVHWDLVIDDVGRLVSHGATRVRARGGDIDWDVMADPEGNEFCAFHSPWTYA